VYAVFPDGRLKWEAPVFNVMGFTGMGMSSSIAIDGAGTLYVGSEDRHFYAVNGTTGAIIWLYTSHDKIFASPVIDSNGTVYIGSADGTLYAISASPAGSYLTAPFGTLQDCPLGSYCPKESIAPTPCPAGTFNAAKKGTSGR
jgi:outer membrane protein assembly factor BamB